MRLVAIILTLILSLSCSRDASIVSESIDRQGLEEIVDSRQEGSAGQSYFLTRSFHGDMMTESGTSITIPVRLSNTGQRVSQTSRTLNLIFKHGKITDNSHIHSSPVLSFISLAGERIPDRYLYSICRLRL